MSEKQIFKIPVTWSMCGEYHVKASSVQEALKMVQTNDTLTKPNLEYEDYISESEEIDLDRLEEYYPNDLHKEAE